MGLSVDELEPPLDDIAYLARSNNRVNVLQELAEGDRTRRALHETTGISQPTLGRVLAGFEERAWVAKRGRRYTLSPLGTMLADEFEGLLDTARSIQRLRDLAPRLPLEDMDFDLRLLARGTITTPTPTDATAHFRRERALLERTDRIRFLCNQAQPETVERYRDWVLETGGHLEAIIAGDAIDVARADDEMGDHLRDMIASPRVTIRRFDGTVSIMLGLLDDMASLVPLTDAGVPCAFIESEDEAVRTWVVGTLETYRDRSVPVTTDSHAR